MYSSKDGEEKKRKLEYIITCSTVEIVLCEIKLLITFMTFKYLYRFTNSYYFIYIFVYIIKFFSDISN